MKFTTQTPGKTVYESYATVREHILQRIQKNYNSGYDIVIAIENGKEPDWDAKEPKMERAQPDTSISDLAERAKAQEFQQEMNKISYQEKLGRHLDNKNEVKQGLLKAYTEIFMNFCTKSMQQRLEEHPDFATEIKNKPIGLLEVIKQLQHSPMRARHPLIPMVDAWMRFSNMKQYENEDLHGYTTRFKQYRDVLKAQIGTRFLDAWTENLPVCQGKTPTEQESYKEAAFEAFCAYMFLRNADQAKYGSRLQDLQNQFAVGTDQYPATLTSAIDILANHKLDEKYRENQRRKREQAHSERSTNNDNNDGSSGRSFAQDISDVTCHCCGKKGHYATTCNKRNLIPRDQWHVNQALLHLQ